MYKIKKFTYPYIFKKKKKNFVRIFLLFENAIEFLENITRIKYPFEKYD